MRHGLFGLKYALLLWAVPAALWAAEPTGSIAGSVLDPSGAAIVAASITATNLSTGLTRQTTTAADGGYLFPLLPVGTYSVQAAASGFERYEQRGIEVKTDQSATVPISLKIGSSTQAVTVQANAEMVQTQSGALSQVVNRQNIVELPLNGRNAATLILLTPGTADTTTANFAGNQCTVQSSTYPGAQAVSANGARTDMVNYNLDGGSNVYHRQVVTKAHKICVTTEGRFPVLRACILMGIHVENLIVLQVENHR